MVPRGLECCDLAYVHSCVNHFSAATFRLPPSVSVCPPELLLLTWGLFFISASSEEEPELHARDFSAPVKKLCQGCHSNQSFDNQVQDETHRTNGNIDVEGGVEGPK